jgi:hypothetical protein
MDPILPYQAINASFQWEKGPPLYIQLPPPFPRAHLLRPAIAMGIGVSIATTLGLLYHGSAKSWWTENSAFFWLFVFLLAFALWPARILWKAFRVLHLPTTIEASLDGLSISAPHPPHFRDFHWDRPQIVDLTTGHRGKSIRISIELADGQVVDLWFKTSARLDLATLEKDLATALGILRSARPDAEAPSSR